MKPLKRIPKDQKATFIQQVLNVFQDINKFQTASKSHIFQLVKLFRHQPIYFEQAWEQAYLKIFQIFHQRPNRKMPPKYENLATSFFAEILTKDANPNAADSASVHCFDFFLQLLSEGIFSLVTGIRITTARILFHLLKTNSQHASHKAREKVLKSVFYLVRLKVSTYKQIGIKLASIALGWESTIRSKLEQQLFKIMSTDQNEQIRKMAMTNLWITERNLDKVLIRLRDKCTEIRSIILRKLVGQKFSLERTDVKHRYHLLYDGYGNKEVSVQQETVKYFLKYFETHTYQTFGNFVKMFSPNTLLAHPHLYTLFDHLISDMIEEIPQNYLEDFIIRFSNELKNLGKGGATTLPIELIWLKNMGRSQKIQYKRLFDEHVPSGTQLAKILSQLAFSRDAFCLYECLQMFTLQKSSDQLGRNKMFDALKKLVNDLSYWEIIREECGQKDDICPALTQQQIKQKKLLLSYFDLPPISCSFDLLFETGHAMKSLWPDHYEIQLKQMMADWNNPQENTLLKERQLAQANIKKAEGHSDQKFIDALNSKLEHIQMQLEQQSLKTKIVIQTIVRQRSNASLQDYMPIIKDQLSKQDRSQGLLLLGLYSLEDQQRTQNFLPLFLTQVFNEKPQQKLHLLVSLRVLTDFFVRFDLCHYKPSESVSEDKPLQYSDFIKRLWKLAFDSDSNIKILAIESLCRLLYHNRIAQEYIVSSIIRLLLLWWETGTEEVVARSVHTISIFIKQYIERGQRQVRKISEWICIFFNIILITQRNRKLMNKRKIIYNLKMEEFIKRAVVISMTVLKYHKQSRLVIWKYQDSGAQLGPQELFLLFLLKQKDLYFCLEKALNICDFYEEAPLETLILVKKQIQIFIEQGTFPNVKKMEVTLKKLESDLQERIQIKNKQTFNEELLNGLKDQLHQYEMLIESQGIAVATELQQEEIFIENQQVLSEQQKGSEFSQQMLEQNVQSEQVSNMEEEVELLLEQSNKQKQNSRGAKDKKKLIRISEKNEHQNGSERGDNEIDKHLEPKSRNSGKDRRSSGQSNEQSRLNRRRIPEVLQVSRDKKEDQKDKVIIPLRTRSKVKI